jgi:hypothetical protein
MMRLYTFPPRRPQSRSRLNDDPHLETRGETFKLNRAEAMWRDGYTSRNEATRYIPGAGRRALPTRLPKRHSP